MRVSFTVRVRLLVSGLYKWLFYRATVRQLNHVDNIPSTALTSDLSATSDDV